MFEKIRVSQKKNSNGREFFCVPEIHPPFIKTDGVTGKLRTTPDYSHFQDPAPVSISIDDSPLTEEEKKRYYKTPNNVMGSRKIKELMEAHKITLKEQQKNGTCSSLKMTLLAGLALSAQLLAVLLIFLLI